MSMLALGSARRVCAALAIVALLWAAVYWAMN
jgi:hypothetical protein